MYAFEVCEENVDRLIKLLLPLVRRYEAGKEREFRIDFAAAIGTAIRNEAITREAAEMLRSLPEVFEKEILGGDLVSSISAWYGVAQTGGEELDPLLVAFAEKGLRRLSERASIRDLGVIVHDLRALQLLMTAKAISKAYVASLLDIAGEEAFGSALVDIMIVQGALPSRSIWTSSAISQGRPAQLRSTEDVLVACYVLDKGNDVHSWLLAQLRHNSISSARVASLIARTPSALARFAEYLIRSHVKGKAGQEQEQLTQLAIMLIPECGRGVISNAPSAQASEKVLMQLYLWCRDASASVGVFLADSITETVHAVGYERALNALEAGESGRPAGSASIVLSSSQVHGLFQQFLKRISSLGSDGAADRVGQFKVADGKRQVINELLPLIDSARAIDPRELEAALFNVGVRPIAENGATEKFNPSIHDSPDGDVFPDDLVVVERSGFRLGDDDASLVIRRATVRSVGESQDEESRSTFY